MRYVDSSVERLQVKVSGLTDDRHVAHLQRRARAAAPTGTAGEFVGGRALPRLAAAVVPAPDDRRARAAGLRPGRHAGTAARSAAAPYHVAHPGGRNYEHVPVNAYEAEGRRRARFSAIGHTPGETPEPRELPNPDRPLTLDLRLASGL